MKSVVTALAAVAGLMMASGAQARSEFSAALFRDSLAVGAAVLMVWVPEGTRVKEPEAKQVNPIGWDETQVMFRRDAFLTAPLAWGNLEYGRWDMSKHDVRNYDFLWTKTFLLIKFRVRYPDDAMRQSDLLAWRASLDDSVAVVLTSGLRLAAEPPRQLPASSASDIPYFQRVHPQLKNWLGGQRLLSPGQWTNRRLNYPLPGPPPTVNTFMVVFDHGSNRVKWKDIDRIELKISGQWIRLSRRPADDQTAMEKRLGG